MITTVTFVACPNTPEEKHFPSLIHALASERENLVFILWGSYAQKKGAFIDETRHCVIKSAHPSPLSAYRGFFGSHPFAKANAYLQEHGQQPIEW